MKVGNRYLIYRYGEDNDFLTGSKNTFITVTSATIDIISYKYELTIDSDQMAYHRLVKDFLLMIGKNYIIDEELLPKLVKQPRPIIPIKRKSYNRLLML